MQADNKEPSSTMLYVSNLPFTFVDDDLKKVFGGFEVSSAYVAVRRNGRSKGFGFVTFASTDQQKKALSAFDGKELDGRTLTVRVAHKDDRRDEKGELKDEFKTAEPRGEPRRRNNNNSKGGDKKEGAGNASNNAAAEKKPSDTTLYVSNLPFEFSDDDLKKVFDAHHPVSARIARRRNTRSKGFGFVEFGNKANQQAALALDGHKIADREISVKVSMVNEAGADAPKSDNKQEKKPRQQQEKKQQQPKQDRAAGGDKKETGAGSTSTLYVSNLAFDLTDEQLGEIFSGKGFKPVLARIAKRRDGRSKGFGFVEFANQEAQLAALKAVDGYNHKDRVIAAKVALKDSETRPAGKEEGGNKNNNNNNNNNNEGKDGEGKRKRNRKRGNGAAKDGEERKPKEKKESERLVYVSNLSFEVDDNALAKLFDGLAVKSAHVAVRRNGKSKGFGFVEFNSPADQKKALAKNGAELNGRKLTVEVAKEDVTPAGEEKK